MVQARKANDPGSRLGRSPDIGDVPLAVGWDFRGLSARRYAELPLRTSGSFVLPDRIRFDAARNLYRADFNSTLNREEALTTFWIRAGDLAAVE